ncbi:MAG TPA: C39 family peptidase, partial [Verrucomicrobiae bacterium]|nr:C39 family peptidase [Verrucomicrobiae bacterium]
RTSVKEQKDADGSVRVDTLILNHPAETVQIRLTLGGTNDVLPKLKFLGLSFCNTKVTPARLPPNRQAWGKVISTPERKQRGYPGASGWCSPTSVSMVLARWADVLHRPGLNLSVPKVATAVYDDGYAGTGNWPFNTAFAGSLKGMRAYVTRFDNVRQLEDWIVAGIPVIISARWDLLAPGRPYDPAGHLTVCIGFTKSGNFIINDPATDHRTGRVRCIYKRENVIRAWSKSHRTVYLVYPVKAKIPANRYGQW